MERLLLFDSLGFKEGRMVKLGMIIDDLLIFGQRNPS